MSNPEVTSVNHEISFVQSLYQKFLSNIVKKKKNYWLKMRHDSVLINKNKIAFFF